MVLSLLFLSYIRKQADHLFYVCTGEKMEKEHLTENATKRWKVLVADTFIWGVPERTVGLAEYLNTQVLKNNAMVEALVSKVFKGFKIHQVVHPQPPPAGQELPRATIFPQIVSRSIFLNPAYYIHIHNCHFKSLGFPLPWSQVSNSNKPT